jgi:hypothetical protein
VSTRLNAAERKLRARAAAHASWANTSDPSARSQPGRDAFLARFEHEGDPHRELPEPERLRRAEHARKAYFTKLSLKAAQARRKKAKGTASRP